MDIVVYKQINKKFNGDITPRAIFLPYGVKSNSKNLPSHGPIGIKLGGKSAPEIALSIIAQLVSETYKK